jgi:hypothetical protein
MPQHQHLLGTDPPSSRHHRLKGRLQPPPAALGPGLPNPGELRCRLHPPITDPLNRFNQAVSRRRRGAGRPDRASQRGAWRFRSGPRISLAAHSSWWCSQDRGAGRPRPLPFRRAESRGRSDGWPVAAPGLSDPAARAFLCRGAKAGSRTSMSSDRYTYSGPSKASAMACSSTVSKPRRSISAIKCVRNPCSRIQPNNASSGEIALRKPIWTKLRPGTCSSSINRRIGVACETGWPSRSLEQSG